MYCLLSMKIMDALETREVIYNTFLHFTLFTLKKKKKFAHVEPHVTQSKKK